MRSAIVVTLILPLAALFAFIMMKWYGLSANLMSLAMQTEVEKIVKSFPEVIDMVSKTGRADIASDPDGVSVSDCIITLKPREEWTSAKTKEELVEKMREAVSQVPGMSVNFTQPIQLRVDELVSGVKSAIGIKIFGDDLDMLRDKGDDVARVMGKVTGAADVGVEKVSGPAYLQIEVDREKRPPSAARRRAASMKA